MICKCLPGIQCRNCQKRFGPLAAYPGATLGPDKTLRDEFAMYALAGSLARQNFTPEEMREAGRNAYALADAMLAERERTRK